ncbi:MAG UNVERIFIED_CONTAM: substrate-binding domain-containing protein [Microcystis novacekii LVE1205-3]
MGRSGSEKGSGESIGGGDCWSWAGNPKSIQSWADLAREDVTVLSADPKTSGIAIWQLLALWGSVTQTGGEPAQALGFCPPSL